MIVGTRPEAIKLAPVAHALAERRIWPSLVFSGQHAGLDPADFGLGGYPAVRLCCPGMADPHAHVRLVSRAVAEALGDILPELVIVQGDTSTALGGALAAKIAGTRSPMSKPVFEATIAAARGPRKSSA